MLRAAVLPFEANLKAGDEPASYNHLLTPIPDQDAPYLGHQECSCRDKIGNARFPSKAVQRGNDHNACGRIHGLLARVLGFCASDSISAGKCFAKRSSVSLASCCLFWNDCEAELRRVARRLGTAANWAKAVTSVKH